MKNKKSKEKNDLKPEPIAVVYGPPPRPSLEERINLLSPVPVPSNPPSIIHPNVSAFTPIPPPPDSKKKTTKPKKPIDNPEDKVDVYGPPPANLFDDD